MRRREFISALAGAAIACPIAGHSQQQALPIVGWLHGESPEAQQIFMPAFHQGLAATGYVEGGNVAIEHVSADGQFERGRALASSLIRRQVALIVTDITLFAQIAKSATQTIPVVFLSGGDAVEFGLVASLNRPGGNLTGVSLLGPDLTAKRLEVLHKLVPSALIGALIGSRVPQYSSAEARDLQNAAGALGVSLAVHNVATESEIAAGFAMLVEQQVGAVLLSSSILFQRRRDQILALAARHAMPTMFWDSASVPAGALSSYGPDFAEVFQQAGRYVGRILKGEKPADLPVVQPSKFEFAINLRTAKQLGLTVPPTLLAIADKVIE